MSEFTRIRAELSGRRADSKRAAAQLALAREQLRNTERRIAAVKRGAGREQERQLAELERQAAAQSKQVVDLREQVTRLRAHADDLLGSLIQLADPTRQIAELSDRFPILLFPVRLETRFRPAPSGDVAGAQPQLWIRIYPDDCQVDSFEALLTETEVNNARAFWIGMWRAGRVEAQERGAWRSLVGGSGSGRASYIVRQYQPTNPAAKPTKIDPQDIVLVIVPQIDLTSAEQSAAFTYFTNVWKADGDAAQEALALEALRAAVGNARAEAILTQYAPDANGQDPPKPYTRAQVRVQCAVLKLPAPPPTKTTAWTQAPKAFALPDRFVALLWNGGTEVKRAFGGPVREGLAVAPDPSLPAAEQIHKDGDDLVLNEDLLWLADFERAVAIGMGIKVDLTPAEASAGFDRLLVLGLRFASDEHEAKQELETLITHHHASRHGFSLVPQGSPTNNTQSGGAAYSWVDDADVAYDIVFKNKDAYVETDDPLQRRDGQWLAAALGIDHTVLHSIPNAAGRDQGEARAMNAALWPATGGYAMEEMVIPLFSRADIAATQSFFTRYVSGRGPLPAVRVGAQPYGVLPALAFSRYSAGDQRDDFPRLPVQRDYLRRLHGLLLRLDAIWRTLSANVAHVGNPGADAHQTLLDVLGLHSGAVEYHQRYAESFEQLYNKLVLQFGQFWGGLVAAWLKERGQQLLAQLGADPGAQPPILEKFFYGESPLLRGPVVDDVPLSETEPVRGYTPDNKNYLEWLATSSLDVIRRQDFAGNPAPTALLYLMLRHAAMLSQWDAGMRFLENRGLVDANVVRREPAFLHVEGAATAGQSKFQHLYAPQPVITGDNTTTLSEYVLLPSVLAGAVETQPVRAMLAALKLLKDTPTGRLERAFAEHIDCCSYRLDAWKTALAAARLEEMRVPTDNEGGSSTGLYLGAFGWLENLRPKPQPLLPVSLDSELATVFQRPGDAPLVQDPANAGYIHAPSLNHAAAAAVLKNAYAVNASAANPDAMTVNLSSDRVRRAMTVLEGMRNGQTLAALLGYRFERGLHDAHNLAEIDKFIYPLRQAFPLVANQLKTTKADDADITLLEARNVLDGLKLVKRIRAGEASYPFGLPTGTNPGELPSATAQERAAIDTEADALANLHDAVADLVLAESTYQVVLGNFDRAAANTNAFSKGSHPPEIQVVDTPRTGLSLTHRVALHLDPGADPNASPSAVPMTPRAQAEAPLNLWLAGRLPDPANVVVRVTYTSPALAAPKSVTLTQTDLGLQPIDLLYLVNLELDQALSELDDRILQVVRYGVDAHPGLAVTIEYTQAVPGRVSLLELAALVRSLRVLLLRSRAIGPADMAMPLEAKSDETIWDDAELQARVSVAITALKARRDALLTLQTDPSDLDDYARKASDAFLQTALHGIPQTGSGQIHGDMRAIHDAIAAKLQEFATRWDGKSADYANLLATWPALATDEEKFALLQQAEGLIAATTTATPPADPNVYKLAVEGTRLQFNARLAQIKALLAFAGTKLVDFAAAADALRPQLAQHDAVPFDIADQASAITALRATLVARVTNLVDDLTQRIDAAETSSAAVASLASSQARVEALRATAKRVLGDEFQPVPRCRLSEPRGLEFEACAGASAVLLTDLKAAGRRFPVDDWLYGLARVRDKLSAWENVAVLSEAFGAAAAELTPVQLPFATDDRWLALEFDPAAAGPSNRLLYTAHFATAFDRTAAQCGLLLDEWPELVPGTDVMSGVAFHFDRPSSQPPQMLLLAVPPALVGHWRWDDLVATLNETLDAAKTRGVEPAQIDTSSLAQFLPATLMAVTLYQLTISTNLALNNNIYDFIQP